MKPGLYPSISHEGYHADPCPSPSLSASIAHKLVTRSPLHAWHAHPKLGAGEREDPTAAMDNGTLVHRMLLGKGPDLVRVEADDWRTKAAKEARDAAREAGKLAVLAEKLDAAIVLSETLTKRLKDEHGIVLDGLSEVTAVWREGDVWCRGRFDHWKELGVAGTIYDLKFVDNASPEAFARHMVNYGSDIQEAAYVSAVETLYPPMAGRVRFWFIAIESSPPHPIQVYGSAGSMRELGRRKWRRAVDLWSSCLSSGKWPGYGSDVLTVEAPAWEVAKDMEKQINALQGGSQDVSF